MLISCMFVRAYKFVYFLIQLKGCKFLGFIHLFTFINIIICTNLKVRINQQKIYTLFKGVSEKICTNDSLFCNE